MNVYDLLIFLIVSAVCGCLIGLYIIPEFGLAKGAKIALGVFLILFALHAAAWGVIVLSEHAL